MTTVKKCSLGLGLTSKWYYLDPDAKEFFQEETGIKDDEELGKKAYHLGCRELEMRSWELM